MRLVFKTKVHCETKAYLSDSTDKGSACELAGSIDCLPIISRSPAAAVNVNVLGVEREGARLNHICYLAIKHADTWRGWGESGVGVIKHMRGWLCTIWRRCQPSVVSEGLEHWASEHIHVMLIHMHE